MEKVLIAVDDTKGTKKAFSAYSNFCACMRPKVINLVYVEKFEGSKSLIDEMLGDAEMDTLRDVLKGTAYQGALDKKARTILTYYKKALEQKGLNGIKTIVRNGHPAEEILKDGKGSEGGPHHRRFAGAKDHPTVHGKRQQGSGGQRGCACAGREVAKGTSKN